MSLPQTVYFSISNFLYKLTHPTVYTPHRYWIRFWWLSGFRSAAWANLWHSFTFDENFQWKIVASGSAFFIRIQQIKPYPDGSGTLHYTMWKLSAYTGRIFSQLILCHPPFTRRCVIPHLNSPSCRLSWTLDKRGKLFIPAWSRLGY